MNLKNYDFIKTSDGSLTAFSKLYNETCHSQAGAETETLTYYIKGCQVEEKSKLSAIKILEVGFGTGMGFELTLRTLQKNKAFFTFISVEIDKDLVEYWVQKNKSLGKFEFIDNYYKLITKEFELYIIIGDARETLSTFQKSKNFKFNCIYQDAFSPKRNSILWTKEWFDELFSYSNKDCIMSTYSASSSIRKSMVAAGWSLYSGDQFGKKRSSTLAKTHGESDEDILSHLQKSPVGMITDENYKQYVMDEK